MTCRACTNEAARCGNYVRRIVRLLELTEKRNRLESTDSTFEILHFERDLILCASLG